MFALIGGLGTVAGPIAGTFLVLPIAELARGWLSSVGNGMHGLIYGLILVAVVLSLVGPDGLAVLHSGLSDGERLQAWARAQRGQARMLLGTRMAIFAPMGELGLIVVDEEHDASYKQQDGLRYFGYDGHWPPRACAAGPEPAARSGLFRRSPVRARTGTDIQAIGPVRGPRERRARAGRLAPPAARGRRPRAGDQAEIDRHLDGRPEPRHGALLQHAQQLDLLVQRQVADFIQEQRAAAGRFEVPRVLSHRAGETALFVTK